ncbi:mucin-22-like [Ictalurus furcatus]|uniref:mucin-22-like n=1 Tax=Ictalurus furcatus TaxID=66913 RepID=UPI00235007D1|nr:mucin-22-like [Ictalurus furcatus]
MNTTSPPLTTSTTTVTEMNITGFPPSTTEHQHQSHTTSNERENYTTGLPTSTPLHQHQSQTTLKERVTDIYTTGLPTITTEHQHQSHTTLNTTVADNNTTTLLPNTTKHQHSHATVTMTTAEIVSASTSDSVRTSSTMNTTSPPLTTSTTTETSPKCSYTLEEENDTVKVKIDKNDSADKYKINFTDTSDGSSTKTWPEESFPISLKSFKPCQNYTVTLTPSCKPTTGFFKTSELVDSDVSHTLKITGAKVQVCFETKWDLSKCIDLDTSISCTGYSVTFNGDPCKKSIPFTLPPVKPVINYTNKFPTKLRWDNQPSNCLKDLTYNCNGLAVADFEDLKPFHDYACTGTYDYENGTITSDPIPVKIDCGKQGHTKTSSNSSTQSTPAVTPPVFLASTQGVTDDKNGSENMKASTSDSSRTSSTMNTTSPPLTTSTTTDNDDTGTPTRTSSHSDITPAGAENYTTGLPTITTEHQHQSHTTLNTTVADNNTTTLLPNTTKHQHSHATVTMTTAEIVSASTSDSSRNSSTMNTTPPPLTTSTTTETSPKCNYTLEEENDTVTVKINKNDSADKYKIKFTDTSDGSTIEESFPISLKSFKPCQNYNVTFDPPCNPMTGFFKTRELVDSDVSHTLNITGAKVQVCFETKWNLSECVDLNTSDSCTGYSVTFKGDPCKKSIPFTIPPVKPVINYTNKFPTKLRWDNQPSNCRKDLTYNCNGLTVADFEDLKPFHDYACTGTYDYESGTITSDPIPVKIDCDIVNEPSLSVSHNSIHASWKLDRQNCPSITTDFTWDVTCKEHGSTRYLKGHCTKNSCEFSKLEFFTEYTCEFEAAYEKKPFHITTKTTKTWPGGAADGKTGQVQFCMSSSSTHKRTSSLTQN